MAGRGGHLEQILWDERLTYRPESSTMIETCISGAPAAGGICLEHGESACVMMLRTVG